MVNTELMSSLPNPFYIPGYAGCCPQYKYKYRIGNTTIGTTTNHKVHLESVAEHAEKLVMSDRTADDLFMEYRPAIRDIVILNEREGNTIYKHPMISSYAGFVPREHGEFGHSYTVQATEALSDFERLQIQDHDDLDAINNKKIEFLEEDEDKELSPSKFELPLLEISPDCEDLLSSMPITEHLITVPIISPRLTVVKPRPSVLIHPPEIYLKGVGQMPHYGGHIPGAIFRYGHTFGNDSTDAKRWLRGDYRN